MLVCCYTVVWLVVVCPCVSAGSLFVLLRVCVLSDCCVLDVCVLCVWCGLCVVCVCWCVV